MEALGLGGSGLEAGLACRSDWPTVEVRTYDMRALDPLPLVASEADLLARTRSAASALALGDYVGSLEPGLRADFVVLDQMPWFKGHKAQVVATFVDGVCRHGCRALPAPVVVSETKRAAL